MQLRQLRHFALNEFSLSHVVSRRQDCHQTLRGDIRVGKYTHPDLSLLCPPQECIDPHNAVRRNRSKETIDLGTVEAAVYRKLQDASILCDLCEEQVHRLREVKRLRKTTIVGCRGNGLRVWPPQHADTIVGPV